MTDTPQSAWMREYKRLLEARDIAMLRTPFRGEEFSAAHAALDAHVRGLVEERDADARRLDAITTRGWALLPPDRNNATWAVQDGELNTLGTGESARDAIDAAMAPDTQTEGESDG